jgi:type III secretory pathway component EscT
MRRVITGVLLGTIVGAIQVGFFKQSVAHLFAAIAAGIMYMVAWVVLTDWLKLAGGKILLGAVSGLLAAIVWWAIAIHADNVFLTAAVAGACFGATYAWSDQRMT